MPSISSIHLKHIQSQLRERVVFLTRSMEKKCQLAPVLEEFDGKVINRRIGDSIRERLGKDFCYHIGNYSKPKRADVRIRLGMLDNYYDEYGRESQNHYLADYTTQLGNVGERFGYSLWEIAELWDDEKRKQLIQYQWALDNAEVLHIALKGLAQDVEYLKKKYFVYFDRGLLT